MRSFLKTSAGQILLIFALMTTISVLLFLVGAIRNGSWDHWYLLWNLLLSWVPLVTSLILVCWLRSHRWASWIGIGLTAVWLMFLPNTFYMITDFIHLDDVTRVDLIFDTVLFSMLIFTSVALGLASLGLVHAELSKRLPSRSAWRVILILIASLGFAVFVGRELRWNTWDIFFNPTGMLFDISELVIRPWAYPEMFVITLSFFVVITTLYYSAWRGAHILRAYKP